MGLKADDNSILTSVKKFLGIEKEYDHFDADIIMHINAAFGTLFQIGLGKPKASEEEKSVPFFITGENEKWSQFIDDPRILPAKEFVYLSVKKVFDPHDNGIAAGAADQRLDELTFRLQISKEVE